MLAAFLVTVSGSNLSVDGVLEHVRKALTAPDAAWSETELSGSATFRGIKHEYSLKFLPDGRFVQTLTGPLGEKFGFDGETYWQVDRSRSLRKLDLADRDWTTVVGLTLTSGWLSRTAPVTITEELDALRLTLKASARVETIHVDPKTWLPIDATFPVPSGNLVLKLDGWRAAGNVLVPMRVEMTEAGETDVLTADKAARIAQDVAAFRVPDWKPTDVSFDASKPALVETRRAESGHVLVSPRIDGRDAGWFILDSGAGTTVVNKSVADELKLASIGELSISGVAGSAASKFRLAKTLSLGRATLRDLIFGELDLDALGKEWGIRVGGVLGSDFFRRTIVAVDVDASRVEVYERDGFALSGGKWLPLRFSNGHPAVEARAAGTPSAWYRFDTGSDASVIFHTQFARTWKLLDGVHAGSVELGGVGGTEAATTGKIPWFELADHRFENPEVMCSHADRGALSDSYLAGNIGQVFMRPFRVLLDFSGYRIALVPIDRGH